MLVAKLRNGMREVEYASLSGSADDLQVFEVLGID
jgi:hypothetical protein